MKDFKLNTVHFRFCLFEDLLTFKTEKMANLISIEPELFYTLKDVRNAINNSYRERRKYNGKGNITRPVTARYKLTINFLNGDKVIWYSLDYHSQQFAPEIHDEFLSYDNILAYFNKKWHDIKDCYIHANTKDEFPKTDEKNYNTPVYTRFRNKINGRMEVRVNPDINFEIKGKSTVVKLMPHAEENQPGWKPKIKQPIAV